MSRIRALLSSVRIKFRKTSTLTKIVVSAALLLSMAALLTLHSAINETRETTENLRQQAIALESEQQELKRYETEKGTIAEVIRIAMERLGLVKPDSIVIQPE